jgi:quinol monooxygenase YgiN
MHAQSPAALGARGGFAGTSLPSRAAAAGRRAAAAAPPLPRLRAAPRTVAAIKVCSKRSIVKAAVLHAEEGKADAVRELCLAHMKSVAAAKARWWRGAARGRARTARNCLIPTNPSADAAPRFSGPRRRAPPRRVAAQARNKKLGIATFDCHEDPFEPGTFHFWERYDTHMQLAAFNSSATQQDFEAKARPARAVPRMTARARARGAPRVARGATPLGAAQTPARAAGGCARVSDAAARRRCCRCCATASA